MNTAIVYYSMSGNTTYTAQKIAAELGADLIEIRRIEAWDGKLPVFSGSSVTPFIDIEDFTEGK